MHPYTPLVFKRNELFAIIIFSFIAHILVLALPAFTIQLFDQVLNSGSLNSLLVLAVPTAMALLAYAGLDWVRSQMILSSANRLERNAALQNEAVAQHKSKLANYLRSQGPSTLLDAAFTPIYILLPFLFHFWAGIAGIITVSLMTIFVLIEITMPSLSSQGYWDRLIIVRSIRLICQFGVIVTGGFLLINQAISIGGMIAIMLIIPKALAGMQGLFTVLPATREANRSLKAIRAYRQQQETKAPTPKQGQITAKETAHA